MAISSIQEALDIVKLLEPLTSGRQLTPPDLMKLMAVGFDKVDEALAYLDRNLPTGDPRRPGIKALMEIRAKSP